MKLSVKTKKITIKNPDGTANEKELLISPVIIAQGQSGDVHDCFSVTSPRKLSVFKNNIRGLDDSKEELNVLNDMLKIPNYHNHFILPRYSQIEKNDKNQRIGDNIVFHKAYIDVDKMIVKLEEVLKENPNNKRQTEKTMLNIIHATIMAMFVMAKHDYSHGDLHTRNIMLTYGGRFKLIDFGKTKKDRPAGIKEDLEYVLPFLIKNRTNMFSDKTNDVLTQVVEKIEDVAFKQGGIGFAEYAILLDDFAKNDIFKTKHSSEELQELYIPKETVENTLKKIEEKFELHRIIVPKDNNACVPHRSSCSIDDAQTSTPVNNSDLTEKNILKHFFDILHKKERLSEKDLRFHDSVVDCFFPEIKHEQNIEDISKIIYDKIVQRLSLGENDFPQDLMDKIGDKRNNIVDFINTKHNDLEKYPQSILGIKTQINVLKGDGFSENEIKKMIGYKKYDDVLEKENSILEQCQKFIKDLLS